MHEDLRFRPNITEDLLHSPPYDNVSDGYKLKEFADDKINVTHKLKFEFGRVENAVEKSKKIPD